MRMARTTPFFPWKDWVRLVRRCSKPDWREFRTVTTKVGAGALVAGFVGFSVKIGVLLVFALIGHVESK